MSLPEGTHQWLLRVRGKGRLWLDDKVIAEIDYGHFWRRRTQQGQRIPSSSEGAGLRYLGPGDREKLVVFEGDGKEHLVVLEVIAGNGNVRATLGETSLSVRQPDGGFALLTSGERTVRLTDDGWGAYRRERMAYHRDVNRIRRLKLRESEAKYWDHRHRLGSRCRRERGGDFTSKH